MKIERKTPQQEAYISAVRTAKQAQKVSQTAEDIAEFLLSYEAEHGELDPHPGEIADRLNISVHTVDLEIRRLEEAGLVYVRTVCLPWLNDLPYDEQFIKDMPGWKERT